MSKMNKTILTLLVGILFGLTFSALEAAENYPYFDPKKDGYNIKDDESPWFDGKDYPFFQDMFD